MSNEVFNRYEKKYLIDDNTYQRITDVLNAHAMPDTYQIRNIYLDTEDDLLIRKSISKPSYKEKVRLRAYGAPNLDDSVYFEIKKKVGGLVNKRRTKMKLSEAYRFIEKQGLDEVKAYHNPQVVEEITYLLKKYDLRASTVITYDRIAYAMEDLRVTFDTNIRTRLSDLKLEMDDYGRQLNEQGTWLMEVKTRFSLPLWFAGLLSENKQYPIGYSKYGYAFLTRNEYEKAVKSKGETTKCLNRYLRQQTVAR